MLLIVTVAFQSAILLLAVFFLLELYFIACVFWRRPIDIDIVRVVASLAGAGSAVHFVLMSLLLTAGPTAALCSAGIVLGLAYRFFFCNRDFAPVACTLDSNL